MENESCISHSKHGDNVDGMHSNDIRGTSSHFDDPYKIAYDRWTFWDLHLHHVERVRSGNGGRLHTACQLLSAGQKVI